jgi:hypothetical protein
MRPAVPGAVAHRLSLTDGELALCLLSESLRRPGQGLGGIRFIMHLPGPMPVRPGGRARLLSYSNCRRFSSGGTLTPASAAAPCDRVLDELRRLRGLGDDWDGQGALDLDPANVDRAIAWVEDMRRWHRALPATHVLPGTLGEVVLEWRGKGFHLAAEIASPERVEWLLNLPGQPIKQWETDARGPWIVRAES